MTTATASRAGDIIARLNQEGPRRALAVKEGAVQAESRTVELAFASEEPYERWFGIEVLDCAPGSIRMARLMNGAPLLFNHDYDRLIGVVESISIDSDRVCRAKVRFARTEDAEEAFALVQDGILRHVSVGYRIHAMQLQEERDGVETYRVTDWEPLEISMVSVPADATVGVGRSLAAAAAPAEPSPVPVITPAPTAQERKAMTIEVTDNTQERAAATADADVRRRDAIIELGVKYADYLTLADVQDACRSGKTVQDVQELVMSKMTTKHSDTRAAHIGLSNAETQRYSIARAVAAMVSNDWTGAGLEREASEECARRFKMGTKGLLLPFDVLARDFTVGTAAEAGNLVPTQLRDDLFADVLRNRLALSRLGVTMLYGLTSNIDLPRKTVGSAAGFVTEIAAASETQPNTGKVTMSPKRISAFIEFSKQAVIQSAMAVEPMLRQDLNSEIAVQMENAAINGSGSGANPRGIRNVSGIGSVIGGTNGAQLNWGHLVGLESACANANAEPDQTAGYLINTRTRGWTKTVQKAANLPFIWDGGNTPLNSYRAEVTNNVPNTLTKGTASGVCSSVIYSSDWSMFVLGTFGAVEILLDEITLATTGMNRLIVNAFMDAGCRRPANFAAMDDALTA
ncbi:phage major capsid protein [Acidovorax lacteus]|uniref:Phage major capsid protein n=1 Tax=Acidovorax lacteus TaxID=1924988 RepID=A0ABP8L1M7_9BURK